MTKTVIGLTGTTGSNMIAGCGKDTVAEMISAIEGFKVYGLADPIYAMVKAGFGIDGKDIDWNSREAKNAQIDWLSDSEDSKVSLRYLLETLGTEWGRNFICNDVWLRVAEKFIKESDTGVVIKDIRFPNEMAWLDKMGGVLIHILRPNFFNTEATKGHPSNIPLPLRERDIMLVNDSSIDVLENRVKDICSRNIWV